MEYRNNEYQWTVTSPELKSGTWYMQEWSWDPENGLSLYIDGKKVASQEIGIQLSPDKPYDDNKPFYIGRTHTDMISEHYANVTIDELQVWEIKRDYLIFTNEIG